MVTTLRRRRVFTQQQRLGHLAAFERSGLSQTEFCRRAKLHPATFSLWRRAAKAAATSSAFAEVRLNPPAPLGSATLLLPSGAKLEVSIASDATWVGLGLLLQSLQS